MQIIIIRVPDEFQQATLEKIVTTLMNAKNGQILISPHGYEFQALDIEGDGEDLIAVTKDGHQIKIIHDPREEKLPEKAPYEH
jgi:hypothetical protein